MSSLPVAVQASVVSGQPQPVIDAGGARRSGSGAEWAVVDA